MEFVHGLHRRLQNGGELEDEEYQRLRALQDRLDDINEILAGRQMPRSESGPSAPASGPAFAIVVGHTRRAPGADSVAPIGENEYPWNVDLANRIHAECQARGVESHIFFRDDIGISGAYAQVDDWGASCIAELHFNAFDGSAHGTETLYDKDTNPESEGWARALQTAMVETLGLRDRGVKERDPGDRGYTSLSATRTPTALIEPFFGDNAGDAQIGHDKKPALAAALAETAAARLLGS